VCTRYTFKHLQFYFLLMIVLVVLAVKKYKIHGLNGEPIVSSSRMLTHFFDMMFQTAMINGEAVYYTPLQQQHRMSASFSSQTEECRKPYTSNVANNAHGSPFHFVAGPFCDDSSIKWISYCMHLFIQ